MKNITFTSSDTDYKLIASGKAVIKSAIISSSLPSLPTLTTPEKGILSLAEEWDERYAEFIKAGKHRRLGIYFKYSGSTQYIRRFGILLFNQSPAKDTDLLAMLIERPKKFSVDAGVEIYGKVESGTFGLLQGEDKISVWLDITQNSIQSLWMAK